MSGGRILIIAHCVCVCGGGGVCVVPGCVLR